MELLLKILKVCLVIFEVLLLFNFIILVHELGHFFAARWRGLKIEKFQIWFGKPIIKKEINGVQWGLGSIPAGGFVALPQLAPMDALEGRNAEEDEDGNVEELPPISALDKIIVAFAGPLFSLGLAFCFGLLVWVFGVPTNVNNSKVIGVVVPGSPAEEAGLRAGDEIVTINGDEIVGFGGILDSVMERIAMSRGDEITFVVNRPGVAEPLTIKSGFTMPKGGVFDRPGIRKVGIGSSNIATITSIFQHSPAERVGLEVGDRVVELNGDPVYRVGAIIEFVEENPEKEVSLKVVRGEEELMFDVAPAQPKVVWTTEEEAPRGPPPSIKPMLGVQFGGLIDEKQHLDHPGPVQQIRDSLRLMYRTITAVASPKSDIKLSHMSGALGIGTRYYDLFTMENGWRMVLWFSVILNVNLAVLNMLPFPVLDGGHITIAILESIRRKPIKLRVLEVVQTACALALISFMVFVTWFDGTDLFKRAKPVDEAAAEEAAEPVITPDMIRFDAPTG